MAAKQKIKKVGKIEIIGGQAKPGPELASFGINMGPFIKEFNEKTSDRNGEVVPTIITAYDDRSFSFVLKTTPTSRMILKFAKVEKGSANSPKEIVGSINMDQVEQIAKYKQPDLNVNDLEAAKKQVMGTAKNMGIEIKG